ncbi:MAG: hypothetical protein KIT08_08300 [Anaerolineales bacterium]|nr:MAG: hypothetical protein KIT08_08300 [Anaerolineales bacterium]
MKRPLHHWLRIWLQAAAFGALLAVGLVFAQPSQQDAALLLGLSLARLALVALLLGLAAGCTALARAEAGLRSIAHALTSRPIRLHVLLVLAAIVFVLALYLVLFSLRITDAFAQARLLRILPLSAWLAWAAAGAVILWPRLRPTLRWGAERSVLRVAAPALATMLLVVIVMVLTGLGLSPDRTGWDTPGAPILNTQVLLSWLAAVLLATAGAWAVRRSGWRQSRLDAVVAIGLWLLAVLLWTAEPLRPTHFSPAPSAPNWEYYPNSDAATLDIAAQSFLTGNRFTDIIEKPLYGIFLVGLHAVAGQEYADVVNTQILVLALFPVVLYFIAAQLHHRFSGILLALLIIFREVNTLALSNRILVSHSKLLMTDLPTALGLAALTLFVLHWLQHKQHSPRAALWVGAALGLLFLLRSQTLIFLPVLLLLAAMRIPGGWRSLPIWRMRATLGGLLLLGFVLAAVPWMLRNGARTGEFGYSQPYQALYMARQYSLTPESNDPGFDVETTSVDEYASLGFANVRQFVLEHPVEVTRFITAHFLHNEVASFLALPARFDLTDRLVEFYNLRPYWPQREAQLWTHCCSLSAYIDNTPYWADWDGIIPPDLAWPLTINMALVALGIGAAWRRVGWLTLIPLGLHLLYSASTALARVSGWRLILPADWVLILFYALGIGQLTLWAARYLFGFQAATPAVQPAKPPARLKLHRGLVWTAVLALLAGSFIPLAEGLLPNHYASLTQADALQRLQASPAIAASGLDPAAFLSQPGAGLYWGRAMYPRHQGAGTPAEIAVGDGLPFDHTEFRLVGPQGHFLMALPGGVHPFPNAADVIVLACQHEGYFYVAAVHFLQAAATDALAPYAASLQCSSLP